MGLTHFSGISVSGTIGWSGPASFNGTVTFTGSKTHKMKGSFACWATATLTGGKTHSLKGTVSIPTAQPLNLLVTGANSRFRLRANGTGALCGVTAIGASGIKDVSVGRLTNNSVLILTPSVNTALVRAVAYERRSSRTTGAAGKFRVYLTTTQGTAMTGKVNWMIVN